MAMPAGLVSVGGVRRGRVEVFLLVSKQTADGVPLEAETNCQPEPW